MNIQRFPGTKVDIASTTVCGLSVCSLVCADIKHLNPFLKMCRMLNMERVHIPTRKRRHWCQIKEHGDVSEDLQMEVDANLCMQTEQKNNNGTVVHLVYNLKLAERNESTVILGV
jgi:hypothetical protein